MKVKLYFNILILSLILGCLVGCQENKWSIESHDMYKLVKQSKGPVLGINAESGIELLYSNNYVFKDLNRNGKIDIYEDWRKTPYERATDLASRLSLDEIAGLMLYSTHQAVPTDSYGFWSSTYNGVILEKSGLPKSAVSDKQKKFLKEDNLRAVLVVRVESPVIAAEWNNNMQAYVEGLGHGIPVNISSDPRNETKAWAEYNAGSGGKISLWPCPIGMAATFDPKLIEEFGHIASIEYRALGIATALSPQIDLATEPRWNRFYGTFGEDPKLAADMAKAYIDGFQTSKGKAEIADGWGYESVNAMVKHWPGGGPEEGGRDAHYSFGKYTVYPGKNIDQHLYPFIEGAFKLNGKTGCASAVMPYYTISYGIDPSGKNVGNGFSKYLVTDLLRDKYKYDGVVCTDWGITHNYNKVEEAEGKCWGMEAFTIAQRHYFSIMAGVDQFGGNNDKKPVLEAYDMLVKEFGKEKARERFESSARRLLLNIFRTGLFENPYVDTQYTKDIVGNPKFMKAGYEAQLKSIVMLKNKNNVLPAEKQLKVYIPGADLTHISLDTAIVKESLISVSKADDADIAIVFMDEPKSGDGYDVSDRDSGGNGYIPISLQYEDYKACDAREQSLAGGDVMESFINRSYKNKSVKSSNIDDLKRLKQTKYQMKDKPVIAVVSATKPFVPAEFEPVCDAILLTFGVQHQAVIDIIVGNSEPSGLLPMQMPANMKTVELQNEDVPKDMDCYKDCEGNFYDFAFGLNWKGVINDNRVIKYK